LLEAAKAFLDVHPATSNSVWVKELVALREAVRRADG